MGKARNTPPIAPKIAAPIRNILYKMYPKKPDIAIEKTYEKTVPRKDNSEPLFDESMFKNWKRSIVIPKPDIAPVAKMVYSKNFLPWKATNRPNIIALRPKIIGLSTKKREKLVTEMRLHALG